MVFAEPLEEYTDLELAWLQRLYETRAPAAQGTLSLQLVTDMFVWNREVKLNLPMAPLTLQQACKPEHLLLPCE